MVRRLVGVLPAAAAAAFVLTAYAFFASAGTWEFRRIPVWWQTFYANQAEGFLSGQLSIAGKPEPELLALENPYLLEQRASLPGYMWDASLYNRKYYLYFSPVPVLLFVIPFKLVATKYPSDELTAAVFCAWAFLASVAFLWRAGMRSPLWVLLAGVGGIVPFFLLEIRVYEVAAACGLAMGATWAYTLLRFLQVPSPRTAFLMGLFLGLTIATRPNMIVLLPVALLALWKQRRRVVAFALVPVFVIGSAYAVYNYARFGSPFETGLRYQLTAVPMQNETPCRLCNRSDLTRFFNTLMHYTVFPPKFFSVFPFVDMRFNDLDMTVSFPAIPEQVAGIAAITPLTMLGTALGALLLLARRAAAPPPARAAVLLLAAAWIVLLALSTCRWVTARYSLDFYALMVLGTIVAVEHGLVFLKEAGVMTRPIRAFVVLLACYSIVTGLLLGFMGRTNAFKRMNPARFEAIEKMVR
ncbi:MAG TPA: hypothetical protein VGF28_26830 [Thermoanaerobaculia bacterium]|jgi:hypothetical protein